MVGNNNTRGYFDWLTQRVSAVIVGAYAIFLLVYLFNNQPLYFAQWQNLFHTPLMRIATFVVILSVLWHAWIGLWTVFTDYVKPMVVRVFLQIIVCVLLIFYLVWAIEILWA